MVEIGFRLSTRETLTTEEYTPAEAFELGRRAEEVGFDSVWVGDNLIEKPRLEPLSVLGKLAGLTDEVSLGTACMITSLRNPVQFAQAWATLDMITDGRMVLGACMGTPNDLNRKQHDVVGVPPSKRALALEEGLEVMQELWENGEVTYDGDFFDFEDVSFDTGTEVVPLEPVQDDPTVMVVSNPSLHSDEAVVDRAVERIVDVGNGWMTCCRADHPEEFEAQYNAVATYAETQGVDPDDVTVAYNLATHLGDSTRAAETAAKKYIASYFPVSFHETGLADWGPMGTPDDVISWIERFADLGCDRFIFRFEAADRTAQFDRFAEEVLPSF